MASTARVRGTLPPSSDVALRTRWCFAIRSSAIASDGRWLRGSSHQGAIALFRHDAANQPDLICTVHGGGPDPADVLLGRTRWSDRPCRACRRSAVMGLASEEHG